MWIYELWEIPFEKSQELTESQCDKLFEISAFTKYQDLPPVGRYPETGECFMLVDLDDSKDQEFLKSIGFQFNRLIQGDCPCCRGMKTAQHIPEPDSGTIH